MRVPPGGPTAALIQEVAEVLDAPPPSDKEAEMAVVAAMLIDDGSKEWRDHVPRSLLALRKEDFWHWPLGLIYAGLRRVWRMKINRRERVWFLGPLREVGLWDEMTNPLATLGEVIESDWVRWRLGWYAQRIRRAANARMKYFAAWQQLRKAISWDVISHKKGARR